MKKRLQTSLVVTTLAVLFASCQASVPKPQEPGPLVSSEESLTQQVATQKKQGPLLVTYVSGEVRGRTKGDWKDLEEEDSLEPGTEVKTGPQSECEIQLGTLGLVHLSPDTVFKLQSVLLAKDRRSAELSLVQGAILAKVDKLIPRKDRFQIRTPTVIAGVRGTIFQVRHEPGKPTFVAVKQGRVALLPPSFDTSGFEKLTQDNQVTKLYDALEQLYQAAPMVETEQEASVTPALFASANRAVDAVNQAIRQDDPKALDRAIEALDQAAQPVETKELSPSQIPEFQSPPPPASPAEVSEGPGVTPSSEAPQPPPPTPEQGRWTIETVPADAEILSPDGKTLVATGRLTLPAETESLDLQVSRLGYIPRTLKLTPGPTSTIKVKLEREYKTLQFSVDPPEATIALTGVQRASGKLSARLPVGSVQKVKFSLPGYQAEELEVTVDAEGPTEYSAQLARVMVPLTIQVEPKSAEIQLGKAVVGTGQYTGSFPTGDPVTFNLHAEGWVDRSVTTIPTEKGTSLITISLVRPVYRYRIVVQPAEAQLQGASQPPVTERLDGTALEGTRIAVQATLFGYKSSNLEFPVSTDETWNQRSITLVPKQIYAQFSVSKKPIIALGPAGPDSFVAADSDGILSCWTVMGKLLWKTDTGNRGYENPQLITDSDRVYLGGNSTFGAWNIRTGQVVFQRKLDPASVHSMGRHVVPLGNQLLYPTEATIRILDATNGKTLLEVPVPGNSMAVPTWSGDSFLTINQNGELMSFQRATGKLEWTVPTPAVQALGTSVQVREGVAYVVGRKGILAAVDLEKRKVLWTNDTLAKAGLSIVQDLVIANGTILAPAKQSITQVATKDGKVTGTIRGTSFLPAWGKGLLGFGTTQSEFQWQSAEGKTLATVKLSDRLSTSILYLTRFFLTATKDGTVTVINPEGQP